MSEDSVVPFRGHLISITGTDATRIIDAYFRLKGEITPSEMAKLEQTEKLDSRGVTDREWRYTLQYRVRPQDRPIESIEEILRRNEKDFDALHVRIDKADYAPDR